MQHKTKWRIAGGLYRASRAESTFGLTLFIASESSDELVKAYKLKGLILAQNERWRHGLGMQVAREPN